MKRRLDNSRADEHEAEHPTSNIQDPEKIQAPRAKFSDVKTLFGGKAPLLFQRFANRLGTLGLAGWSFSGSWILALGAFLLTSCSVDDRKAQISDLKCYPPSISLVGAKARQSIVVQASLSDGTTRDVTYDARCRLADGRLASFGGTGVSPRADGRTDLLVTFAGRTLTVPVTISNASVSSPIGFKLDVMPVFMKAGCNAGSCHGASRGKDGFRLSLFGFDPDGDYYRLTREQIGRRVNLAIPEESLIVQKGLGAVQHTGGVRFGTNSDLCRTFIEWLTAGATNDPPSVPRATGIEIFPRTAVLEGSNNVQRLIVRAHYSDGTDRDVTPLAVFISNNDVTAKVAEDGLVTSGQRGEAFIQARFAEFNVGAEIVVIPKNLQYRWPEITAVNYIDEAIYAK